MARTTANGIVNEASSHSVYETVERLKTILQDASDGKLTAEVTGEGGRGQARPPVAVAPPTVREARSKRKSLLIRY